MQETYTIKNGVPTIPKTVPGVLDYLFDWTQWLPAGDSVTSYQVTAQDGITLDSHQRAGAVVAVWLSDGDYGKTYLVRCRITTAQGRTDERTIAVTVVDRR